MSVGFVILGLFALFAIAWAVARPPSLAQFENQVRSRLEELGLQVDRLPEANRARLAIECKAVHTTVKRFDPKRLAMRFYTWNVTSRPLAYAKLAEGASLTGAILTFQKWQKQDSTLKSLAQKDIQELAIFLCNEIERSDRPRDEILGAQAELLALAAGRKITERDLEKIADEIVAEHRNSIG